MQMVVILGASGLLGTYLCDYFVKQSLPFLGFKCHSKTSEFRAVDLLNKATIEKSLAEAQPNFIINLIAHTNVDDCQRDQKKSHDINYRTLKNLIETKNELGLKSKILHISTDMVYSKQTPSMEHEALPINAYGRHKLESDILVSHHDSVVLRLNFFGNHKTSSKTTFDQWIIGEALAKGQVNLVQDVIYSPISLTFLAKFITQTLFNAWVPGIYNFGVAPISKLEFGKHILRNIEGRGQFKINEVSLSDLNLHAPRPLNMSMNSTKIEKVFRFKIPSIQEQIQLEYDR